MKSLQESLLLFFKGLAMGGADAIPGVSGGTIAFITGIYDQLLRSIKAVDIESLRLLFKLEFRKFWEKINGAFLLPLVLGIFTSLLSVAKVVKYLQQEYPVILWSFFFGLIVISSFSVARQISKWTYKEIGALLAGIVIAYLAVSATPASTPETWWFVFLAGAVAICAMILPGLSGAFILLVLGKYHYMMTALLQLDLLIIIIFAIGCLFGLMSFARAVSWLMEHHNRITVATLAGFMIGSLYEIWPWKVTEQFRLNSAGEQVPFIESNVLPHMYQSTTGNDPQILFGILFFALGVIIVVIFEKIAMVLEKRKEK